MYKYIRTNVAIACSMGHRVDIDCDDQQKHESSGEEDTRVSLYSHRMNEHNIAV